jgi:hypothetical protein
MPRKEKTTETLAGVTPRTPKRTLATKRLICLLTQLKAETGLAMVHVARDILGIDSTIPSKLMASGTSFRNANGLTIEKVVDTFGIDPNYFSEPSLGTNPDYRPLMRRARGNASTLSRRAAKQAAKRLASAKRKPGRTPSYDAAALPDDVLATLDNLYASAEERAVLTEVLADCRFPFVNQALVQGIISGIRKGQRMNQYVDDALNASIDEQAAKSESTERDAQPDGNDEDVA